MRELIDRILIFLRLRSRRSKRVFTTDRETVPQYTRQDVAEYWTGRGVDYRRLWGAYDAGSGYIAKYESMDVHLFVIEFAYPPKSLPLFDHEVVLKTLKGIFHDLKRENLNGEEYEIAGPLFLYSVERGSGIYKFFGELRQLLMFGTVLGDERIMDAHLKNKQKRINFLKKNFPAVDQETAERFLMAKTTYEMDEALERLIKKGIKSIKISAKPVLHTLDERDVKLIEIKNDDA